MSVMMIVNFQAAEGNAEALRSLLQQGRDISIKAEGCEAFDLYQAQADQNRFVMVQRWVSDQAHHANFEQNIKGSGHLAKIMPLLAKPIDGNLFHAV